MREKILRNLFEKINQSHVPDNYKEINNIMSIDIMKVIKNYFSFSFWTKEIFLFFYCFFNKWMIYQVIKFYYFVFDYDSFFYI